MAQIKVKKQFRESLILTAIEGVEEAYKRQSQEVGVFNSSDVLTLCVLCRWVESMESYHIVSCQVDAYLCNQWSYSLATLYCDAVYDVVSTSCCWVWE